MTTRIGSLFSGAGGLDMAVEQVFGGEVIWQSEMDKAASAVLAYRFPSVPNLGDITAVDWSTVESPDVLCGGFPCQDVSSAGRRAGIKDGTRSGLWSVFADAIDHLRPPFVVIENVRGLLSARANRNLESDDATVGDRAGGPVLRAAGAVFGDLADLGYDAQWATVAAADVGAPHRRERVFILASDTSGSGQHRGQPGAAISSGSSSRSAHSGVSAAASGEPGVALLPTPNADVSRGVRIPDGIAKRIAKGDKQFSLEDAVALLPTPRNTDGERGPSAESGGMRPSGQPRQKDLNTVTVRELDNQRGGQSSDVVCGENDRAMSVFPGDGGGDDTVLIALNGDGVAVDVCCGKNSHSSCLPGESAGTKPKNLPGPLRAQGKADSIGKPPESGPGSLPLLPTPASADGQRGQDFARANREGSGGDDLVTLAVKADRDSAWGKYEPAIRRWESLVGPAPAPTEPNKNGNPRLSAAFSEWLMGWPQGWVTHPAIGISRNDQLRIVGNGVCPQQAIAALRFLLAVAHGTHTHIGSVLT